MCHCQSTRLIQTLDTLDFVTTNYSQQLSSLESQLQVTQSKLDHEQTENAELREAVLALLEAVEKSNGVFKGWPHCKMKVTGGHLAEPMVANAYSKAIPQELHAHLPSVVTVLREQLTSERESHQTTQVYAAQLETKLARREAELKLAGDDEDDLTRQGPSTYHWDEKLQNLGIENVLGSPLELATAVEEPYESSGDEATLSWAGPSSQPMRTSTPRSRHSTPQQQTTIVRRRRLDDHSSEQSWDESFTLQTQRSGSRVMAHPLLTPTISRCTQLAINGRHSAPSAQPSTFFHSSFPSPPERDTPRRHSPRKSRTKTQVLLLLKQRIDILAREVQEVRGTALRMTATASGLTQDSISLSEIGSSSSFDHLSYPEDHVLPVPGAAEDDGPHLDLWAEAERDAFHREASLDERADSVISMELCSPLPQASEELQPLFSAHYSPPTSTDSSPTIRPSIPRSILATLDSQVTVQPVSSFDSDIISPLFLSGPLDSFTAPLPRSSQPNSSASTPETERGGSDNDTQEPFPVPPPIPSSWPAT